MSKCDSINNDYIDIRNNKMSIFERKKFSARLSTRTIMRQDVVECTAWVEFELSIFSMSIELRFYLARKSSRYQIRLLASCM